MQIKQKKLQNIEYDIQLTWLFLSDGLENKYRT